METFFAITGAIGWVCLGLTLLTCAVGYAREVVHTRADNERNRIYDECSRELGIRMVHNAYWFTEDLGAWKAIECYGNALAKGRGIPDEIRDTWRKELEKEKAIQS